MFFNLFLFFVLVILITGNLDSRQASPSLPLRHISISLITTSGVRLVPIDVAVDEYFCGPAIVEALQVRDLSLNLDGNQGVFRDGKKVVAYCSDDLG